MWLVNQIAFAFTFGIIQIRLIKLTEYNETLPKKCCYMQVPLQVFNLEMTVDSCGSVHTQK